MKALPFLVGFAKPCNSPGRADTNEEYFYDQTEDMVRWIGHKDRPFAIDQSNSSGPMTKKADIEKGEDNKDRRMWR